MFAMNIVIVLLLIIICLFVTYDNTPILFESYSDKINTDPNIINKIRQILKDTHDILSSNDIVYWIDGGTLLGAVRHSDVIPWDDDGDICILKKNEAKFKSLKNIFHQKGYGVSEFWGGYKIFPLNGSRIKHENKNWSWTGSGNNKYDYNYKYPFVDVFICEKYDNIYHYSNNKVRNTYKKYYHEINNLFPLKEYKFNNFKLYGPNNAKSYLDRAFGKDWKTVGYKSYDHENLQFLPATKFKL